MVAGNDRNAYAAKHRDMLDACPRGSDSHIRELHSMPDIDVCKWFVSSSALFVVRRIGTGAGWTGATGIDRQRCSPDKGSDS